LQTLGRQWHAVVYAGRAGSPFGIGRAFAAFITIFVMFATRSTAGSEQLPLVSSSFPPLLEVAQIDLFSDNQ